MKTKSTTMRPSPILMLAPLAFVLLAYNYASNIPQQRELSARRATLNKLETSAGEVRHQHSHVMADLAKARQQEKELREQLAEARSREAQLIADRSHQLAELFRPAQPAASITQTLSLLERHQLICLDKRAAGASRGVNTATTHEVLKPIADLLGGAPKQGSTRSEYRIKLSGRYADLRRALHELLETQSDVMPLAIEMEAPEDLRTDRRTWILTLLV